MSNIITDISKIPIIIVSFNRFTVLKNLVEYFLNIGEKNIIILDNNSTYEPLLKWFNEISQNEFVKVVRFTSNYGHTVFWRTDFQKEISQYDYFAYTDNDIIPYKAFDENWKLKWIDMLHKYKVKKIGAALNIDDIPDCFKLKDEVQKYESKYWQNSIETNVFSANVDTTLFICERKCEYTYGPSLRMAGDYLVKHTPWYMDFEKLSEEDEFYFNKIGNVSYWGNKIKEKTIKI